MEKIFYKVVCVEVDVFGVMIWQDSNQGTIESVHKFVKEHINEHPYAKWELYPLYMQTMS